MTAKAPPPSPCGSDCLERKNNLDKVAAKNHKPGEQMKLPTAMLLLGSSLAGLFVAVCGQAAGGESECIFSETECTCSLNPGGNLCLRRHDGSGDSLSCDAYACGGGYICDCSGDVLCPVETCAETIYHPLEAGAVPGDVLGCTESAKERCIREPSGNAMPSTIPTTSGFVEFRDVNEIPSMPSDLKMWVTLNPYTYEEAATVPTFQAGGYRFWPLSYADERNSLAIVVFDEAGNVVRRLEKSGTRMIYQVEIDHGAQEIVFIGEGLSIVRFGWDELTAWP